MSYKFQSNLKDSNKEVHDTEYKSNKKNNQKQSSDSSPIKPFKKKKLQQKKNFIKIDNQLDTISIQNKQGITLSSSRKKQQLNLKIQLVALKKAYEQLKIKYNKRESVIKNLEKLNIQILGQFKTYQREMIQQTNVKNQILVHKDNQIKSLKQALANKQNELSTEKLQLETYRHSSKKQFDNLQSELKNEKFENIKLRNEIKKINDEKKKQQEENSRKEIKKKQRLSQQQNFLIMKINELSQKLMHYTLTMEKSSVLRQKNEKIQKLQKQLRKIKLLSDKQIQYLQSKIQTLNKQIEKQRQIHKKQIKINGQFDNIKNNQSTLNLIADLKQKNTILKKCLIQKQQIIDQLKNQIKILKSQFIKATYEIKILENAKILLQHDINQINQKYHKYQSMQSIQQLMNQKGIMLTKNKELQQNIKKQKQQKDKTIKQLSQFIKLLINQNILEQEQIREEQALRQQQIQSKIQRINSSFFKQKKYQLQKLNTSLDEQIDYLKKIKHKFQKDNKDNSQSQII